MKISFPSCCFFILSMYLSVFVAIKRLSVLYLKSLKKLGVSVLGVVKRQWIAC